MQSIKAEVYHTKNSCLTRLLNGGLLRFFAKRGYIVDVKDKQGVNSMVLRRKSNQKLMDSFSFLGCKIMNPSPHRGHFSRISALFAQSQINFPHIWLP